jgi:hypothetical protein
VKSRRPTATLLAWSVIGLLGGHHAAYLLVYRDPAILAHVLEDTGHGWMWIAPFLAAAAVVIAMIVGFRGSEPVRSFRSRFSALALVQVGTFVLIEAGERVAHGSDAADLIASLDGSGWLVLIVGIGLQLLTAFLVAVASRVIERIGDAVRRRRVRPRHPVPRACRRWEAPDALSHGLLLARARGPRAPPVGA